MSCLVQDRDNCAKSGSGHALDNFCMFWKILAMLFCKISECKKGGLKRFMLRSGLENNSRGGA
jgi:hypothetical protein